MLNHFSFAILVIDLLSVPKIPSVDNNCVTACVTVNIL